MGQGGLDSHDPATKTVQFSSLLLNYWWGSAGVLYIRQALLMAPPATRLSTAPAPLDGDVSRSPTSMGGSPTWAIVLVPEAGLEPARPFGQVLLAPVSTYSTIPAVN